jgi:hypothetical protein
MKLTKEKRDQLILVVLIGLIGIAGLWFGLISFQRQHLITLAKRKDDAQVKLAQMQKAIKNVDEVQYELQEKSKLLAEQEENMASGDLYGWIVDRIKAFQKPYKVDLPQLSQPPLAVKDMDLLPKFPYKQISLKVGGSAYYHELGKFLADFENQFPHMRIVNLEIDPVSTVGSVDKDKPDSEKLTFTMDIVALVKPGAS